MWPGIDPAYLTVGLELLAMVAHVAVIGGVLLARRRDPTATLAWILFIVLAPVVGVLAYLALGRTRMRRAVKRSDRAHARIRQVLSRRDVYARLTETAQDPHEPRTEAQIRLGNALASAPASSGNRARVLHDAGATYAEMMRAIEAAEHHVHVQFYIIQPDAVGTALRDCLVSKASAGVEVRVLYDAVGSMGLPAGFWEPLRAAGGATAAFGSLARLIHRWRHRDRVDYRNHRKIVVVDGRLGFTGGINVGREYLGLDPKIGRWRDTHVRIEGPAVLSLQEAFLHDWSMTTGQTLDDDHYFPDDPPNGDAVIQIIDSGPDRSWPAMEFYYTQSIGLARQRVWITNPYFVPSQAVESALLMAALRGVDVRLLLPTKSDSWLVTLASRSHYGCLLQAGVRIFEYDRGFVHAKTMVVDEWLTTIGSANMDMRSFDLNFELNAFVFCGGLCRELAAQFQIDLEAAREMSLEAANRVGFVRRLAHAIARLLSPWL